MADYQYEWSEFVIPASDQKGQSEQVTFRMQPGQHRQMQIFVQSRRFPYKTIGDLIRHAIFKHLQYLEEEEGETISMVSASDDINYVVRDDQFYSDMEIVFRSMADKVQLHLDHGDVTDAQKVVARIKGKIANLPDMGWRERFTKQFQGRFTNLLTPGAQIPSKVVMMGSMAAGGGGRHVVRPVEYTESDLDAG